MRSLAANLRVSLLLAAGLLFAGCATTSEPVNLTDAKAAVIAYADSGAYARDLAKVSSDARAWIERRAARRAPTEKLAVVFDIDETVLSSLDQMKSQDFGYVPDVWNAWVDGATAPAIPAVRDVVLLANRLGIAVIYVTGREEPRDRAPTETNLRREGLGNYAKLVMAPEHDAFKTTAARKAAQRAALEQQDGYTIIATIGDQDSDLTGGHAERAFKLPNPFYAIP